MYQLSEKIERCLRIGHRHAQEDAIDRLLPQSVVYHRVVDFMLREGIEPLYDVGVGEIQNTGHAVHVPLLHYVLHHVAAVLRVLRQDVSLDITVVPYVIKELLALKDYYYKPFSCRLSAALYYFDALLHVWIC